MIIGKNEFIFLIKKGVIRIARRLREWYEGAIYHIMQRGIRKKEIFSNQNDYQVFLAMLFKGLMKYNCKLHAYCLMTNHYHLLLETSECEVWKFMKNLAHNYALYYNSVNAFQGHLFEGRYKSCLVDTNEYFLQISRYINLNPVKARMVEKAEDYPWSSYRALIGLTDDRLVHLNRTYEYFQNNPTVYYRDFVEDIGRKYIVQEDEIKKSMGEDELWLPR